jgi:hypothetical protein
VPGIGIGALPWGRGRSSIPVPVLPTLSGDSFCIDILLNEKGASELIPDRAAACWWCTSLQAEAGLALLSHLVSTGNLAAADALCVDTLTRVATSTTTAAPTVPAETASGASPGEL